ncbi:hypothetical protein TNCV_182551 [Trichonephila clavipes]|nr:hypothetical protein TNCV_182551 [Trichonephila clavipes]
MKIHDPLKLVTRFMNQTALDESPSLRCPEIPRYGGREKAMEKIISNKLNLGIKVHSVVNYRVLKMEIKKEKIRYILQFFFDKGENTSQATEIVNGVYGVDTVTASYVQF